MVSVESPSLSINERIDVLAETLENNNLQEDAEDNEVCKACGDRVNENELNEEESSDILGKHL